MRSHRTTRAIGAAALGLVVALAATACGDDKSDTNSATSQPSATEHNDADVSFATDMLQHHAQALVMVDLTMGRTLDPDVQALAEQIRDAQAPEIETLSDWLTEWDESIPATMRDHANGGDGTSVGESMEGMDHSGMPGMMSADDMTALENALDSEFQTMWLEMMVEHHTGAVDMAEIETEEGQYKPSIELGKSIISSQTEEISTMKELLG